MEALLVSPKFPFLVQKTAVSIWAEKALVTITINHWFFHPLLSTMIFGSRAPENPINLGMKFFVEKNNLFAVSLKKLSRYYSVEFVVIVTIGANGSGFKSLKALLHMNYH
jgi:hypothetical protein